MERADGGGDDPDNLIAICVTCHSDVHTSPKLTRRFTAGELKLHRRALHELVEMGRLPAPETSLDQIQVLSATIVAQLRATDVSGMNPKPALPTDGIELLLAAVCENERIYPEAVKGGAIVFRVGKQSLLHVRADESNPGELVAPLKSLVDGGFLKRRGGGYEPTDAGVALADDIVSVAAYGRFTMTKAKCMACGLHFIVCTWHPERHRAGNLHCPECGQHRGAFIVWQQKQFGQSFQHVPGWAESI